MLKWIKISILFCLSVFQLYAQDYCEQPVRGVYESGPEIEELFEDEAPTAEILSVEKDLQIEAGKRAGRYHLGMSYDDVISGLPLGDLNAKTATFSKVSSDYAESFAQGLGFYFKNNVLLEIKVMNENYKTLNLIGVGSTINELSRYFQCSADPILKECGGIGFEMEGNQVKSVHIFTKTN